MHIYKKSKFFILFFISLFLVSSVYAVYANIDHPNATEVQQKKEHFFLTIQHYAVATEGGILTFTVSLNKERNVSTIVAFSTSDISTEVNKDYILVDKKIIIPKGQQDAKVRIQTLDDNDSEAIEFFTLKGKIIEENAAIMVSKAIGIIYNDTPPVKLFISNGTVIEGQSLLLDINISHVRRSDTIVHVSHSDISAEKGKDYQWQDREVIIPANTTYTVLRIPTFEDEVSEEDEQFSITAEVFLNNRTIATNATATIKDHTAALKVSIGNAIAQEGETLVFDVNLSVKNNRDMMLRLSSTEQSAEADKDYKLGITSVIIPAGEQHTTIEVEAIKDEISEQNETFIIHGKILLNHVPYVTEAKGKIIDTTDDLKFSIENQHSVEGEVMTFDVVLNHLSSENTLILLHTIDKTAQKSKDYEALKTQILTIPSGATKAKVDIGILSDEVVEKNETFILNAEINSSFSRGYEVNATGTIINK